MCVLICYTTFVRNVSHSQENSARHCHGLHRSSCTVPVILFRFLKNLEFSRQSFEKPSNIKSNENSSSGSRVVPCGPTDGRTDMTKLIDAYRNFSKTPVYDFNGLSEHQDRFRGPHSLVSNRQVFTLFITHAGPLDEQRYSSSLFGPSALDGGWGSTPRPGRLYPRRKTRYTFYRRLGSTQGRSERTENLVPTGIRSRTIQPVVSRYTD